MSDPTADPGWLAWAADKVWLGVSGLVALVWKGNESKHKETRKAAAEALAAHAAEDDRRFTAVHEEQTTHRAHIGKIFDQMREESKLSVQRHIELLNAIHSKADR